MISSRRQNQKKTKQNYIVTRFQLIDLHLSKIENKQFFFNLSSVSVSFEIAMKINKEIKIYEISILIV